MHEKNTLPLKSNPKLFYNVDKLKALKEELEEFLDSKDNSYMHNREFAVKFMGCQEIQSNNSIEGYNDDVSTIMKVVKANYEHSQGHENIIRNLYNGYKMILECPEINKENLKRLYDILSEGLLSDEDLRLTEDYRLAPVYIYFSNVIWAEPDKGIDYKLIDEYMNSLFEYLNNDNNLSVTESFIKSQIAHYYFVYVHPFFDVNGRTSRTLGMWYLLNQKAYPYIIFNRAIPLSLKKYYKIIRDVNKFKNATFFLNYMLENAKIELEKEHIISSINDSIHGEVSEEEYQTLLYILSLKGLKTCKDYASFYNRINDKKKVLTIKKEMLDPLIDKGILKIIRTTKKGINEDTPNFVFDLNKSLINDDPKKIKRLQL